MLFTDNTGHLFDLPSFDKKPIGYEFDETQYIFWIDDDASSHLSINNYYARPIYIVCELDNEIDAENLEITVEFNKSNMFRLVSSIKFNEALDAIGETSNDVNEYINIFESFLNEEDTNLYLKEKLTEDDLFSIFTSDTDETGFVHNYAIIPIYVLCTSKEEGTWISNLLIHIKNNDEEDWCPVSIGGVFIDEYEELIINGNNMGIKLPKDIIKAVYSESFYNDEFNTSLYNKKLKEYLINYMGIKGEQGNFNSAIKSLKWFEYGDRITISKLLQTDNQFKVQYIQDYFDISYDIIESFKKFKNSSLISLTMMINKESNELYEFNFDSYFYGENKPKMISLLDKYDKIEIGNHSMPIENDYEKYFYWKPYFDFSLNELALKLICLRHFYKKYFLPMNINVHRASLGYRVFANDIKFTNCAKVAISYPYIAIHCKDSEVEFLGNGIHYFTKQIHYVDDLFNEYSNINLENSEDVFYKINDTCINIPIKFLENKYYNCILYLIRNNTNNIHWCHELHYGYYDNRTKIINPYNFKYGDTIKFFKNGIEINDESLEYSYALLKKEKEYITYTTYSTFYKDYNKMLEDIKVTNTENMSIQKLKDIINQHIRPLTIDEYIIGFNDDQLIFPYNDSYNDYIIVIEKNEIDIFLENYKYNDDLYLKIYKIPLFKLRIKTINQNYSNILVNDVDKLILKKSYMLSDKEDIFISNFSFNQTNENQYMNFIIYPKKLNIDRNKYINVPSYISNLFDYWNNSKFIIKLLVNNKWYEYKFETRMSAPELDFGKLKYRYYLNDHNYLISKINNTDTKVHSFVFLDKNDNFNINDNLRLDTNVDLEYLDKSLTMINENFYNKLGLNSDISFIKTIYLDDNETYWQYRESNYNIISNFQQLSLLTNDSLSFNAYMHNKELVDVNEINYDIMFDKILKYNLKNNLRYFDGELLANEFYQYFVYNDKEIILHRNLVGKSISIIPTIVNNILIYEQQSNFYIFEEVEPGVYELFNESIFQTENEDNLLALEVIDFYYNSEKHCYIGEDNKEYYIYEKLYDDSDNIYNKYNSIVNLPNNNKYKNHLIMYDIHTYMYDPKNILIYKNNIDIDIEGLNFKTKKYIYTKNISDYEHGFKIEGYPQSNYIDSRYPDIYTLKLSGSNLFGDDYKDNIELRKGKLLNIVQIGSEEEEYVNNYNGINLSAYFKTINDLFNGNFYQTTGFTKFIKLLFKDNQYYFEDPIYMDPNDETKPYKHILKYKLYFFDKNNNQLTSISINQIYNNEFKYIKCNFYYNKNFIIRKEYELGDENSFIDNKFEKIIKNQNPSAYWYNVNNGKLEDLYDGLNELKRYWYNKNETTTKNSELELTNIIKQSLNEYIQKRDNPSGYKDIDDDSKEIRYSYNSYLVEHLDIVKGRYRIWWKTEGNINIDDFQLFVVITNADDSISCYNQLGEIFYLNGDEKDFTVYFQLNTENKDYVDGTVIPYIYRYIKIESPERLRYDSTLASKNKEYSVIINNKIYKYGDNQSEYVNYLYNVFFENKYKIYDSYVNDQNELINNNIFSIIGAKDDIDINKNMYLNYDFYLMHDDQYWYGLYISRETCNNIKYQSDLKIQDKHLEITDNDNIYVLDYVKDSCEILLNRMEYISSNGYNHFKSDDIICSKIYNNDRLPFNFNISSKWTIKPLSLGMNVVSTFDSNAEMTILSLPTNDNKYQKGYYSVNIKYSLDRDIQHQFKYSAKLMVE